jgi:hypothetical protein
VIPPSLPLEAWLGPQAVNEGKVILTTLSFHHFADPRVLHEPTHNLFRVASLVQQIELALGRAGQPRHRDAMLQVVFAVEFNGG